MLWYQSQELLLVLEFPPWPSHSAFLIIYNMLSIKLAKPCQWHHSEMKTACHFLAASREPEPTQGPRTVLLTNNQSEEHEHYQGCYTAHWACWKGTITISLPVLTSPVHWTCTFCVPPQCVTAIEALGCRQQWQRNIPCDEKKEGGSELMFIHSVWRTRRLL